MLEKPHKKLDVWKKSLELVKQVYAATRSFPQSEVYGLTNQIRRAAISIPSNIAEGAARQTKKEFVQFLHVAQGSLSELDAQINISLELDYLKRAELSGMQMLMSDIDKMLTGLIKSLKRS